MSAAQRLATQLMRQAQRAKGKSMKRPVRKVDTNQNEIVQSLRACGAFVEDTHILGKGFPDILVQYADRWTPIEIKTIGGKLTPDERKWWDAAGVEPNIAHDDQEAMRLCGIRIDLPFIELPIVGTLDAHGIEYAQTHRAKVIR